MCANLMVGFLAYALFLYSGPHPISTLTATANFITALSLYFVAYQLYKKNRGMDNKNRIYKE